MGVPRPPHRPVVAPLPRAFFERDPVTCARELIGCRLVWGDCSGLVVETEAYAALDDEASHTWSRPSARAFVATHAAGAVYVYFNYGVHWMLNVLVKGGPVDGFILFRALEPLTGLDLMSARRATSRRRPAPGHDAPARTDRTAAGQHAQRESSAAPSLPAAHLPATALCSGPGKLAQALGVTGEDHGRDFCTDPRFALYPPDATLHVSASQRIGISRAQHLPWRFVSTENPHLSVPLPKSGTGPQRGGR